MKKRSNKGPVYSYTAWTEGMGVPDSLRGIAYGKGTGVSYRTKWNGSMDSHTTFRSSNLKALQQSRREYVNDTKFQDWDSRSEMKLFMPSIIRRVDKGYKKRGK